MQLYPAIDMKGGKCVRLTQGSFDHTKVYSDDPFDMAEKWVSMGATFLHLVDLDGALKGRSVNEPVIRRIHCHFLRHEAHIRVTDTLNLLNGLLHLCRAVRAVEILQLKLFLHT